MEQPTYETTTQKIQKSSAVTFLNLTKAPSFWDKYHLEKHLGNSQLSAMLSGHCLPLPLSVHSLMWCIKQMYFLNSGLFFVCVTLHPQTKFNFTSLCFFTFVQHTHMFTSKVQNHHHSSTLRRLCCEKGQDIDPSLHYCPQDAKHFHASSSHSREAEAEKVNCVTEKIVI